MPQPPPLYALFMITPALTQARQDADRALAVWNEGRSLWERRGSHLEEWDELVGRWADAYSEALARVRSLCTDEEAA